MDNQEPPQDPTPPQDYATRFRGADEPADGRQAAGTPSGAGSLKPEASAAPPKLAELLEASVVAPLRPWATFGALASRPAPSFGAMAVVVFFYLELFFGLNLLHASIAYPGAVNGYPPGRFAVVNGIGAVLGVLGTFAAAGIFHAAALVCGGQAPFSRSYQAVSTLCALLLVEAAVLWLSPAAVLLPLVAAGVLGAAALETLHGAKPLPARAVCGALVASVLGAAWLAAGAVQRLAAPLEALTAAQSLQAPAAASAPGLPADPAAAAAQAAASLQAALTAAGAPAAPAPPSGLDMVAGPTEGASGLGAAPGAPSGQPGREGLPNAPLPPGMTAGPGGAPGTISPQQMQQVGQAGAQMLGTLTPMLQAQAAAAKDPAIRAQLQQLSAMMGQLQGNLQANRPLTAEQRRQLEQQMRGVAGFIQQQKAQQRQRAPGADATR